MKNRKEEIWVAAGLRTPFVKVDTKYTKLGAIELSVPVVQQMITQQELSPDFIIWGTVAPNLGYSNIAREILMDAELDQNIPAYSTVMACSTSMLAAIEAAGMITEDEVALVGGVESMTRVQFGLSQNLSDTLRRFFQAKSFGKRFAQLGKLRFKDIRLHIPSINNRSTGLSMGEHSEITSKRLTISRKSQDELAFRSHKNYILARGKQFFNNLLVNMDEVADDTIPRSNTTLEKLEKLRPAFDRKSGKGSLTAGNSSSLTDGAAGLWVAGKKGLSKLKAHNYVAKLVDWEIAAVTIEEEGLLMAPTFAIPRLLARHGLQYNDIDLWEIHEAFAAQVLATVKNLENPAHLKKVGTAFDFGSFPWEKLNPNGGSVAIGHPFGATGARIMSQAIKELSLMGKGKKAIVSVCADGGLGSVVLLES